MGFLDNVLKKVGTSLATRYGVIASGEYEGFKLALGNPPEKKVSSANSFSQIIILNENEEVARFNIEEDVKEVNYLETVKFPATGSDGYRCAIEFSNGDSFKVDLMPSKILGFKISLFEKMNEETKVFFEN